MALFKTRPKLRVRVPSEIQPGADFVAVVLVDCKREVEVESLHVTVAGTQTWSEGHQSDWQRESLLSLRARLCGKRTFERGRTELDVQVPLPEHLPPSYRGTYARIEYTLAIYARIAWWPDARAEYEITIAPPPQPSPPPRPLLRSTAEIAGEPYAELSLANDWTRVGGALCGALALTNCERATRATIAVHSVEIHRLRKVRGTSFVHTIDVSGREEGEMIPFEFRLHPSAAAGFAGRSISLAYEVSLSVQLPWGRSIGLVAPFFVLPRSRDPSDVPPRIAPPSVGSDRLRQLWESVGAAHGMRYESHSLIAQRGDVTLTVQRDHRGAKGTFLTGTLQYPELHLDLGIAPASLFGGMSGDVELGDAAWDDMHVLRARDDDQARSFVRPLLPYLRGAKVAYCDDTTMTVEIRDAGQSGKSLGAFLSACSTLASAIGEARAAIVAPVGLGPAVGAWRSFALRLGARLEIARMRIEGDLDGAAVQAGVELHKSDAPRVMWLKVVLPSPLDAQHAFLWSARQGAEPLARFTGELGELIRAACEDAIELRIAPSWIAVALPKVLGLDLSFTEDHAVRRIERLTRIASVLRGQQGPYR